MKKAFISAYAVLGAAILSVYTLPTAKPTETLTNSTSFPIENSAVSTTTPLVVPSTSDGLVAVDFDGKTVKMETEALLIGVVAAEMDANYPEEALKAQAVAARSYILYREDILSSVHPESAVCTSPAHCFAYLDESGMAKNWGDNYQACLARVSAAVKATEGEYMTYEGKPINAVFFAMSGGMTESAVNVWASDIPYLAAVASAGEETAEARLSRVTMSAADFKQAVAERYPDAVLPDDPAKWFSDITRSVSGGVTSVALGNLHVHGSEIRSIAGLKSGNFTVTVKDGTLTFDVQGYGHGVGLSQYGARLMAETGSTYKEILAHYYTGIEFANQKNPA